MIESPEAMQEAILEFPVSTRFRKKSPIGFAPFAP